MGVYVSMDNTKMGEGVASVSLPVYKTCDSNAPCYKECYAGAMCKRFPSVGASWQNNLLAIERYGLEKLVEEVSADIKSRGIRYFRWFVGGDIPSPEFLDAMVAIADECPGTQFLAFTKRYAWVEECGSIPDNLHIVLSIWKTFGPSESARAEFPLAFYDDGTPECGVPEGAMECTGECEACGYRCFEAGDGFKVVFHRH